MKQLIQFILLSIFFSIVNSATLSAQAKYQRNSPVCFYDDRSKQWYSGTYIEWDVDNAWHTVKYNKRGTEVTASFYKASYVVDCSSRCGCSGSVPISSNTSNTSTANSGGSTSYEANSSICYYDKSYDQWRNATYVRFIKSKKQHEITFERRGVTVTTKMPYEDRISPCSRKCGCSGSSATATTTGNPNTTGNTGTSNKGAVNYEVNAKICYYDSFNDLWRKATYLGFDQVENKHKVRYYRNRIHVTSLTPDVSRMSDCPGECGCVGSSTAPDDTGVAGNDNKGNSGNTGNTNSPNNTGNTSNTGNTDETDKTEEASNTAAYYRIENFANPRFVELDREKAKTFISKIEERLKEDEKLGKGTIFPNAYTLADMGSKVYAVKLRYSDRVGELMMVSDYRNTEMMNPSDDSYNPTRAGMIKNGSSSLPRPGNQLRGSHRDGFVIIKAENLNPQNPPSNLTKWVKTNLDGIFSGSGPKLKLNVSGNNELSLCLGVGKIHTFKVQNGQLNKVRSLDVDEDLVAFSKGGDNKYCIVTSDGKATNTNMHFFQGASDGIVPKKLKLWDEHPQDLLKDRPYPTLDYANGEYLLQFYIHMWEPQYNYNLHSGSFRLKIKEDGSADNRQWQTSHTFGMDALHNGTDWISLYSTDGDYSLRHPGVFIDKVGSGQKAVLFSSPQRWAEPGEGDAAHGQMNYFYTGLGGIAHDGNGYGVVFNNPKMKTAPANLPQNVGYVYVKKDFESTPRRKSSDTTIDPTGNLLNAGATDQVTVYSERMNTEPVNYKRKVKWLSNYNSLENGFANNTDIVAIGNKFVVVWEKWAKVGEERDSWGEVSAVWNYQSTEAVVIDKMGNVLGSKSLGNHPLNSWDDLHVQNGKVVWATYDGVNILMNTLDASLNHKVTTMALP
ncbi:MAG: hypothetical protein AAGG75_06035 [Bacteroidota bacterium]